MVLQWLSRNRKYVFPIIALAAFFLYLLVFNVDFATLGAVIARVDLLFFALAVLVGLAEILFFAFSWRVLLNFFRINIGWQSSFLFVLYGYYMDIIIPAGSVTGDATRVYLIARDRRGTETQVVASVFTQRLLGMALNVITLVLGIMLVFTITQINSTVIYYLAAVGGVISAGLILLLLVVAEKSWSIRIVDSFLGFADRVSNKKWRLLTYEQQINAEVSEFRQSVAMFKDHPKVLVFSMLYLILNWACSFSIPYLIFYSLGYPVSLTIIIVTASITVAISQIPIGLPFEVGIPEITMTTLFIALGIPAAISATVTILTRIITLWFRFGIGFAVQQWLEIKPKFNLPQNVQTQNPPVRYSPNYEQNV